ncbi:mannose-1-phosphate guanylyltransferase [Clostridium estertheticum]|uniref:mannose-1-phosphate guanylyltransferase n=1 Tax=Clostridium estertheticum TaxID=238834 RepID=UPI001CF46140|nr:mannose-1-phosphate guanylyltransferase [Clostridium estertheticum]MCB2353557.1 mannose-1-phosphate guanylyltransferase [Clostridium estertheticum]WAG41892.1 mannose-1-phosphate guanylyltransferase [Clostridium estertheticum]
MLCALIMAGGKGERFWPLSTDEKPKQFLKLLSDDTMIQMTVNRLKPLIPVERIFVVTAKRYVEILKEQLSDLPLKNIIVEPTGKNTAPCIALSAFHINKIYKDATIAVLPADHLIIDEGRFRETLICAKNFVEANADAIITIGMKPNRPETSYGYIKTIDNRNFAIKNETIYKVEKFVEKPYLEKAKEYIQQGSYLWNSGMFIWNVENIISLTKKYLKNTYDILNEVAATREEDYEKVLEEKYENVDSVSVDYGIMERADSIFVIPGDFGWDDVGSWDAIDRYHIKDSCGNIKMNLGCRIGLVNCKDNIIVSNNKKIMLYDINDMIIVENDDSIVITNKKNLDKINKLKNCF